MDNTCIPMSDRLNCLFSVAIGCCNLVLSQAPVRSPPQRCDFLLHHDEPKVSLLLRRQKAGDCRARGIAE